MLWNSVPFLGAIQWRLGVPANVHSKGSHILDSFVVLGAASKGRPSARRWRILVARLNSLMLAASFTGIWAYVRTDRNPVDKPSREMTAKTERQRAWLKARTGNKLRFRDIIVRPKTLKTYQISASRFLSFCSDNFGRWPQSYIDLDLCLCAFIEHVWEEGDPKSCALNAISAMTHFMPAVQGKTRGSSRLMKGWTKTELPERAPPLPTLFATAVAGAALRRQDLRLCVQSWSLSMLCCIQENCVVFKPATLLSLRKLGQSP